MRSGVHPLDVPGHICLAVCVNLIVVHNSSKDDFSRAFVVGQSCARFLWFKNIHPNDGRRNNMDYH